MVIAKKNRDLSPCEIIYVRHRDGNGWKWRPITAGATPSAQTYELFYECLTAARSKGYDPSVKYL